MSANLAVSVNYARIHEAYTYMCIIYTLRNYVFRLRLYSKNKLYMYNRL